MQEYSPETYRLEFEPYCAQVDAMLNHLINTEILNYKYSDVLVVGRKGISLFQPHIKKINGKNNLQGIYTIKLFSYTEHPYLNVLEPSRFSRFRFLSWIERKLKKYSGDIILLTDAVNTGREITEVIESLSPKKVSKVCGYLANKDSLKELKQDKFPHTQFSFINIVDEYEYTLEQDRLQHIYQSRLIPSDGDHPYGIYSLKYQISADDLVNYMDQIFDKFKLAGVARIKNKLIIPDIFGYTIDLDYNALCQEYPDLKQEFYEVERVKVRYKIDPKKSQFRISAIAMSCIDTDDKDEGESDLPVFKYRKCGMDAPEKMCEKLHIPIPLKDEPHDKICPLCIDKNISNRIISYAEEELIKILEPLGIKIEGIKYLV